MKTLLLRLALVLSALLCAPALRAQTPDADEYAREFQRGYDALVAGKHDDGIAAMKRCLELRPNDNTAAYNLTCAYALKHEPEVALEWFDKAIDWGFGFAASQNLDWPKTDKDLDSLREDPRFVAALERLAAQGKQAEEYYSKPVVYVPAALENAATTPLLVVLHDHGQTKDDAFAKGPWKQLADELGYALVIPSGKVPTQILPTVDPSKGMAWFGNITDYETNYWKFEKPVVDAVSAFRKQHKLDPTRVHLVGVGEGAIPAFNIAMSSPGLYKGVVTYLGAGNLRMVGSKAGNAVKLGLQSVWLFPSKPFGDLKGLSEGDYAQFLERLGQAFKSLGLGGGVRTIEASAPADAYAVDVAAIKAALQSFGAAATEGSSSKPASGTPTEQ